MSFYEIGAHRYSADSELLQRALAEAKAMKVRPLCMCRTPGVVMYIASVTGRLIVKRMPNTGVEHSPTCDSYEPPPELSGLGQVMGSAIQEDPDTAVTTIKFDFSMSKIAGRAAPTPSGVESDSVKTDGNKLSLRGTLHYLWDQAGFNRWAPAMEGKRSWYTIRKFLLQATEGKMARDSSLADLLYVPESFHPDKKAEIAGRRMVQMRQAMPEGGKGSRRLMLVVGEVKEFGPSRYGHKVVFKHVPDCNFMLNEDIHKRLLKRFAVELDLWDALENTHLVAIATFGINATGIASIEEMALMSVSANWIPIESRYDKELIDRMTAEKRRFVKGVRCNLAATVPLASVVASDAEPSPTAMYIIPPDATQEHRDALAALIAGSRLAHWIWVVSEGQIPTLPHVAGTRAPIVEHAARTPEDELASDGPPF